MDSNLRIVRFSKTFPSGNNLMLIIPKQVVKYFGEKQFNKHQRARTADRSSRHRTSRMRAEEKKKLIIKLGEEFLREIVVQIDYDKDQIILEPAPIFSKRY